MVRISEKDYHLLLLLLRSGRKSYAALARGLGVTEGAVRKRVKRLVREGIIKRFTVDVDWARAGFIHMFVGFDVDPEHYMRIEKGLLASKNIIRVYRTAGDHMYLVEVVFEDEGEAKNFIEQLEGMEGVKRVCPSVVVHQPLPMSSHLSKSGPHHPQHF